jgi:hypothetical protein
MPLSYSWEKRTSSPWHPPLIGERTPSGPFSVVKSVRRASLRLRSVKSVRRASLRLRSGQACVMRRAKKKHNKPPQMRTKRDTRYAIRNTKIHGYTWMLKATVSYIIWLETEKVIDILEAKDRTAAGRLAPPQGLCLMWIKY